MHVRIRELANLFPSGSILIDIGSDHGYLGLQLIKENKVSEVINVDLSKDALDRSAKEYERHGIRNKAVFLVSDGFKGRVTYPDNSVAVIAGLGTSQILHILEDLPDNVNRLLLLSHTCSYRLRKWASDSSFVIDREKYVDDGKLVYLILDMHRSNKRERLSLIDYIFGKEEFWKGEQRELFNKYWVKHGQRIMNIPIEFRDEVERKVLSFLEDQRIL